MFPQLGTWDPWLPGRSVFLGENQSPHGSLWRRSHCAHALRIEVIEEIRRRVPRDFPLCLRFSQWKIGDYAARLAHTPQELEAFLAPLAKAGVDLFHCSQRRFWEAEFAGSDLNLAGWVQKLTGIAAITVGSITLNHEFMSSFQSPETASVTGLDELLRRMERGDFELIAVGRSLIVNPSWPHIIRRGAMDELHAFQRDVLQQLS